MSRWIPALLFAAVLCAQGPVLKKRGEAPPPATKDGMPPEEDTSSVTNKEYAFNPLQAKKEMMIGDQYFKKGSFRAAAGRYTEATKWNSGEPEAWFKLGETEEKLKDPKAAKEAYGKFLELADAKDKRAEEIRKKVEKLK
jgi:tetratricopeptide (TPR) repeat protein